MDTVAHKKGRPMDASLVNRRITQSPHHLRQ